MENSSSDAQFDSGTYGRSFADVYDTWYPSDSSTEAAVARISSLAGPGSSILELGVGTGRLALPLISLGHDVAGLDASGEMLDILTAKARSAGLLDTDRVERLATAGDVANPLDWPDGPFDVIVAAFNLLFNLADEAAQKQVFAAAARSLTDGGSLVIEAFVPPPRGTATKPEQTLELRSVTAEEVTLIATEMDLATGVIVGQHIELRDGVAPRLRPWRIRVASPEDMDRWAAEAGMELSERHGDWSMTDYSELGTNHVSVYRVAAAS